MSEPDDRGHDWTDGRSIPAEVDHARRDSTRVFGLYTLLEDIRAGGQGRVVRAWHDQHGYLAIKFPFSSQDRRRTERMLDVARSVARLHHPCIREVYEVDFLHSIAYIAMLLVRGHGLDEVFGVAPGREDTFHDEGRVEVACLLIHRAARVLDFFHRQGFIHLDLKPENMMIDENEHFYLLDFGLSQPMVASSGETSIVGVGGTYPYASPEQTTGGTQASPRIDVYGLGSTLYALLTGRPPFWGPNLPAILYQVRKADPEPPSRINTAVPWVVDQIVLRCLQKEAKQRFDSPLDLARSLAPLIRETPLGVYLSRRAPSVEQPSTIPPTRKLTTETLPDDPTRTPTAQPSEPPFYPSTWCVGRRGRGDLSEESAEGESLAPTPKTGERAGAAREVEDMISHYRIVGPLGHGAMGDQYLAEDTKTHRQVVIKFLRQMDAQARSRFLREAQLLTQLRHPAILSCTDSGTSGPLVYIVFSYLEGRPAGEAFAAFSTPPDSSRCEAALRLGATIADALEYVHSRGVVHRDVKPSNILIGSDGAAFLTDFGLASAGDSGDAGLTGTGEVGGTPLYMAPEQVTDFRHVRPAADIFGLGATLYELITARPPRKHGSFDDMIMAVLNGRISAPSVVVKGLDPIYDDLLLKALRKKPSDRYASAAEFGAAIRAVLEKHSS